MDLGLNKTIESKLPLEELLYALSHFGLGNNRRYGLDSLCFLKSQSNLVKLEQN